MSSSSRLGVPVALFSLVACGPSSADPAGATVPDSTDVSASSRPVASASQSALPPATRVSVAPCKLQKKKLDGAAWSPDGGYLLTTGAGRGEATGKPVKDGSVDGWDLRRGVYAASFDLGQPKPEVLPAVIAFAADGKTAYGSGWFDAAGTSVVAWDLVKGETRTTEHGVMFPRELLVGKKGDRLVSVGIAAQVLSLELPSLKKLGDTPYSDSHTEAGIHFTPDEKVVLHWIEGDGVTLRDPKTLKAKKTVADGLAVSADGAWIFGLGPKGAALYEGATGKEVRKLEGIKPAGKEEPPFFIAAFSPDGSRVALLRSYDHTLSVSDATTGKLVASTTAPDTTTFVQWSRDGKALLTPLQALDAATLKPTMKLSDTAIWSFRGEHDVVQTSAGSDTWVESDALTGKATGRKWRLPAFDHGAVSADQKFLAYSPTDSGVVRIVRLADDASIELGVALRDKGAIGWAVAPDGGFEGPAEAAPCAGSGTPTQERKGLLAAFFAGR